MDCIRILWSIAVGLLLVSWRPTVFAAPPTCDTVQNILAPCAGFLTGQEPTKACCTGVNNLNNSRKTKADRVAVCNCIKELTKSISYDPKRMPLLSTKCGVKPDFPAVDKNFDCSK
ncbi:hypothetical protein M8C21_033526 [Ambrosia artemisiifolia]|uniref:Non-specific lipid-transfer protein n=1 Tax=Ambrosia artemisiifolia TaxID=4212 RepID=A0AAD5C8Y5_AMBAR|nr:hypothetical protein M8C21_033526 [Ambrosia artemisiifolia]